MIQSAKFTSNATSIAYLRILVFPAPFAKQYLGGFYRPRFIAAGTNVEPLGSPVMGASVFPEMFGGLVANACAVLTVTPPTTGRATGVLKFNVPSANADTVGRANAIASAIVVSFIADPEGSGVAPVKIDKRQPYRRQ
jgi:hypothetical protein